MPSITFDRFDVGLDHRKSASVADANRLRELKNAYVTTGKVIRKRPGAIRIYQLETGTKGLIAGNGVLNTFMPYGAGVTHTNNLFQANELKHNNAGSPQAYPGGSLTDVPSGFVFNGYLYVAATYSDGNTFHYYLDTSAVNQVTDSACPNTKAILRQASRVFAVDGETVAFSKLDDPKTWTVGTAKSDPGFLPTGRRSLGSPTAMALGEYDGKLAVFSEDAMQLWDIDEDQTLNAFYKSVQGLGTRYYRSPKVFAGDLLFLAKSGFRSITTQTTTGNLMDVDVGSAIDELVRPDLSDTLEPVVEYFPLENQLWCVYRSGSVSKCWVYTFSRTVKVSAWSYYEFGFQIDAVASLEGKLYLRSGDDIYLVDEDGVNYTDGGNSYEMRVEMPFLDFKTPGITKYISAMDLVVQGTVDVAFRYDPNDPSRITTPVTVTGDTRGGQTIPVEITSPYIAPVFASSDNSLVQIDALTFYYENLGAV